MSNQGEFRDDDDVGAVGVVEPTGGKIPQILTAIILNILAMGVGASYGIPNVFYVELDPNACNGHNLPIRLLP